MDIDSLATATCNKMNSALLLEGLSVARMYHVSFHNIYRIFDGPKTGFCRNLFLLMYTSDRKRLFFFSHGRVLCVKIVRAPLFTNSFSQKICRLCVILEPMQELMSRHKAYSLSPRDCLKTTLFQKWQRMVAPPGASVCFKIPVSFFFLSFFHKTVW
jgi:hypothetical protein